MSRRPSGRVRALAQRSATTARHNARLVQQAAGATGLQERLADEAKDSLAAYRQDMAVLSTGIVDNPMDKSWGTCFPLFESNG
ncbi:hypothetical protein [Castellaniella denitrificans]|uniref:hypothetical protein n=1 Tax=Castellaniella denitrificans TaxID=56119 RepID=UPI0036150A68